MAEISASLIRELRERTQAGMSDCKNALVEAGGDLEKAIEVILKKGIVKAASRAGRVATEGEVSVLVSPDRQRGVIVEVNCQTDFVGRGEDFHAFAGQCARLALTLPAGADLSTTALGPDGKTVETARQELVARTGENVVVRRWSGLKANGTHGIVHAYVHMGGKLAVLMNAEAANAQSAASPDFTAFVDNCAMQVAAMSPIVVSNKDVSASDLERQREIYKAQLLEEKKPEQAWPKIIEGKIAKWFTEITLLGQESVLEAGNTIDQIRLELGKKLGGEVVVLGFVRYQLGEGIEKTVDDLASEVAKMTGA